MGTDSGATARIDRLRAMYQEQFREGFDTAEFLADDFYAFQVLERCLQLGGRNRELFNLASLIHAERKALMETGARQTLDALRNIREAEMQEAQAAAAAPVVPAAHANPSSPRTVPFHERETVQRAPGGAPAAQAFRPSVVVQSTTKSSERRSGSIRLTQQEITLLSALRGAYRKHFGESFDVEEFARNDLYAKVVLVEAVSSGYEDLIALARPFLDAAGQPRLHRRVGRVDLDIDLGAQH